MPDDLMTIGTFSLVTGLSIPTLRHYDDIGLLPPAEVDRRTNYRRYTESQIGTARRMRLLRDAELPTDDIARIVKGDATEAHDVLARHRAELRDRADRVGALLDRLAEPTDGISHMNSATDFQLAAINIDVDSDEALAVACAFWGELLGTPLEDWGLGSRQVVVGQGDHMGFLNIRVRGAGEPQYGHRAAFGLGVVGLDAAHQRALQAGAVEHFPPTDGENMPRHSRFADPVGNRVVLWEAG